MGGSQKKILENLKNVLEQEECKNVKAVSVYELVNLYRSKNNELNELRWAMERYISETAYLLNSYLYVDFDYEREQLVINHQEKKIYIKKIDGNLVVINSQCDDYENILCKCGNYISESYDKFLVLKGFYHDKVNNVKSINSDFFINGDKFNITISEKNNLNGSFNLSAKIYDDDYSYNCGSMNIAEVCRNNEDEIFKRVFVKISDCPEWTREKLQKDRYEKLKWEIRKQKALSLVRKINPFKKK